jgi:hypothetical protein
LPDLFAGEPIVVHARAARGGSGALEVRGRIAGRSWTQRLTVDLPEQDEGNPALATLWARARVADLSRLLYVGEDPAVVGEITELGLRHRLVTPYTSFVAVEESLVVSDGKPRVVRVPVSMPEGVSYEGVFGEVPKKAAGGGWSCVRSLVHGGPTPGSVDLSLGERLSAVPVEMEPPPANQLRSTLAVQLRCARTEFATGEPISLEIVATNRGAGPVALPRELSLTSGTLRLRVVDAAWIVTFLGGEATAGPRGGKRAEIVMLPRGQSLTYRVAIDPALAGALRHPGVYHLFVERVGSTLVGSNRVEVRIVDGHQAAASRTSPH